MKSRLSRCGALQAILCVLAACALAGCVSQTDPPAPAADVSEPAPVTLPASSLQEAFAAAYDAEAAAWDATAAAWDGADAWDAAAALERWAQMFDEFAAAWDATAAQERAAYDEGRNPGGFMRARDAEDKAREARQAAWENRDAAAADARKYATGLAEAARKYAADSRKYKAEFAETLDARRMAANAEAQAAIWWGANQKYGDAAADALDAAALDAAYAARDAAFTWEDAAAAWAVADTYGGE